MHADVVSLGAIGLGPDDCSSVQALESILNGAADCLRRLARANLPNPTAAVGRIRGTGPGVSFGRIVDRIESEFPFQMESPFEGCETVAGAVLAGDVLDAQRDDALLKLAFEAGSVELPMHVHEHSDRVVFVLGGRGFFHVSPQRLQDFDGQHIRHAPVRERDVLVFTRGTVHTFSSPTERLLLLSYHGPYISLADPQQYTLPSRRVCPMQGRLPVGTVSLDPAWNVLV